jgi:hypothetical protein
MHFIILYALFSCLRASEIDSSQSETVIRGNLVRESRFSDKSRVYRIRKDDNEGIKSSLSRHNIWEYELDRNGVLLKSSFVVGLVILILGAGTVLGSLCCGFIEGMQRRKRIRDWDVGNKGIQSPRKYTQSFGDPETHVESLAS